MPLVLIMLTVGLSALVAPPQVAFAASKGPASISAGGNHSCAIENGEAYCWGSNADGELGDGASGFGSSVPVAVNTSGALAGQTLTQIAAGDADTCAVDSAGAAYCWGSNQNGQLGDSSTADSSVPVAVDTGGALAGKTLTQVTAADGHTCALDSAGAAYCWGLNVVGELGDGSMADSSVPVPVDTAGALAGQTLTQVTAVGFGHTCALSAAGAAYCWGDNDFGQLGDGSTSGSSVPVAVDTSGALAGQTLTQVTAAGAYHTCALDSAGAAYCWGYNDVGQLGDDATADSSVPVAVKIRGALAGQALTQIAAGGGYDTCAVAAGGAAYCWGDNFHGELGTGSTASSSVPMAVDTGGALAGKTLTQIAGGYFHTCAVDTAGAAYCWGDNATGDLGERGILTQSDVPVLTGPRAPSGVTAVPRAAGAIVSWTAPASLDGGHLTGYTATASPGGATCATQATTCAITGLAKGTAYSITVVAHTTAGDSGASAAAVVTPGAPGPIISGKASTKCVDDLGDSTVNGTKTVIWDCNGSAEQNWTVENNGSIQVNSKCLDIYREGKASNTPVELWTCTGRANQRWQARSGALINPVSGKCLDDPRFNVTDGTQLEIYTCNGGANQQWELP